MQTRGRGWGARARSILPAVRWLLMDRETLLRIAHRYSGIRLLITSLE
jgi:hypothetical protein